MSISNSNAAYVNRSGTSIPVYSKLVSSQIHVGGHTAGGTQIGTIYPNEFYTVVPNSSSYITHFKIYFRNSSGVQTTGYIETSKGTTLGDYAWSAYQEPYHYYNSNGSTLVSASTETIGGKRYYVFTVNKAVAYKDKDGNNKGTLSAGTKLATDCSTTGETYGGYMLFKKKKLSGSSSWSDLIQSTYGFVNLGLSIGSMPSDRAIR